jgi:hypothetical protein
MFVHNRIVTRTPAGINWMYCVGGKNYVRQHCSLINNYGVRWRVHDRLDETDLERFNVDFSSHARSIHTLALLAMCCWIGSGFSSIVGEGEMERESLLSWINLGWGWRASSLTVHRGIKGVFGFACRWCFSEKT